MPPRNDEDHISSINTSLLPSDNESDHEEDEVTIFLRTESSYKAPSFIDDSPNHLKLQLGLLWAILCFIALLGGTTLLFQRPDVGSPPTARKAASMAAFISQIPPLDNINSYSTNETIDFLCVWSGMGHEHLTQNDTFMFDLAHRRWTRLLPRSSRTPPPSLNPPSRWKSASLSYTYSNDSAGLLVIFGADHAGKLEQLQQPRTSTDIWLLRLDTLTWEEAVVRTDDSGTSGLGLGQPQARHGHTAMRIPKETKQPKDEVEVEVEKELRALSTNSMHVAIFGGMSSSSGVDLGDTWIGEVAWPNITWRSLDRDGNVTHHKDTPSPRHGHTSVMLPSYPVCSKDFDCGDENGRGGTAVPALVVFGGKDSKQIFYNDLWVLPLVDIDNKQSSRSSRSTNKKSRHSTWERILPEDPGSEYPPYRAHHAAAIHQNRLFIFGGLSGPTLESARPLDDVWVFDFGGRRWTRVIEHGAKPLPRFLFSSVVHTSSLNKNVPHLYVFGGETLGKCKLNDVWALNLETLRWELLAQNFFTKPRCDALFN